MSIVENLAPVFGSTEITFLSDNPSVVTKMREAGLSAFSFVHAETRGADLSNVVMVSSDWESMPWSDQLGEVLGQSKLLMIPQASFGGDPQTCLYAIESLQYFSWDQNLKAADNLIDILKRSPGVTVVSPIGTEMHVALGDSLDVLEQKQEVDLIPGEWVAVASYLEVALIPPRDSPKPRHRVDGIFVADGNAVAHHRIYQHSAAPRAQSAWQFIQDLRSRGEFPLRIAIEDSEVREIRTNSRRSILDDFIKFVDTATDRSTVEVAFALGAAVPSWPVDWSFNTPINEGAGGCHIALGVGLKGAHIDFIDSTSEWKEMAAYSDTSVMKKGAYSDGS